VLTGGGNQRLEQPGIVALLGVPLHADHETVQLTGCALNGLDDPVFGPRHRNKPRTRHVDRLVMVGRYTEVVPARHDADQPVARGDAHPVLVEAAVRTGVAVMADQVGQVLVQGAAQGHVQNLHAAADAQQRYAFAQRRRGDGKLPVVTVALDNRGLRVRFSTVTRRVDVRAAREYNPVEVGYRGGRFLVTSARRQQHGPPAVAPDRVDVAPGQQRRLGGPATPLRVVRVRRYANDWPHGSLFSQHGHSYLPIVIGMRLSVSDKIVMRVPFS
jgi:hypothetical protein